jgi:hypothetical protein
VTVLPLAQAAAAAPPGFVRPALGAALAVALFGWLWVGRAPGPRKRLVFRFALLLLSAFLVWLGRTQGIFAQASPAFRLALGAIVLLVAIGNLYAVRFCSLCGRMVRNFKLLECPRCKQPLPRDGFTDQPRRPPIDPLDPLGRRRARRP